MSMKIKKNKQIICFQFTLYGQILELLSDDRMSAFTELSKPIKHIN